MDKQPVGQLPDLTQSNNDDEIMVITNSEYNQLKKEKISDLITDFTSTNENNALTKGTDGKMFVTDFGNASNITEGTLPVSVLPDIPKDKLPEIETDDLPDSGITAGTYTYPTDIVVNSKGQVTSITEGQPGANNANQDLSNLGPLGLDKINQSKALETGSVSSDADVYADIQKYAHSTFDLSKFEVVGSPVITEDGIASGFSDSNYITTSEFKLGNGAWRYSGSFITGNDVSGLQIVSSLKGSGITFYNACGAYINNNKLYLSININGSVQTASVDVSPLTYYNFALNFKNPNYVFEVNNEVIKTYNSSELVSFNQSNLVMSIGQYSYSGSTYSGLTGSIDLKSIAIWADGIPVFNGNKTGLYIAKSDNYEVVGSPTITDDGVVSNIQSGVSISTPEAYSLASNFTIISPAITVNSFVDNTSIHFCKWGSNFYLSVGTELWLWSVIFVNKDGTRTLEQTGISNYNLELKKKYVAKFEQVYKDSKYIRTLKVYDSEDLSNPIGVNTYESIYPIYGDTDNNKIDIIYAKTTDKDAIFDLNTCKFYQNGNLIYQPCLKIPYTLSKTGSKIVDAAYRDRVQDVYEQYGTAMYYTLDEENQNFTLPMGEIYGMIEKKNSGGGLEVGDIGIAALGIDETKGLRRYLNGQILTANANTQEFINKLKSTAALYPSIVCTETEWQGIVTNSDVGQCGKFVINYDTDDTTVISVRLPKIIMPIQGLTDLTSLGTIVEAGLPDHTHTSVYPVAQDAPNSHGAFGTNGNTGLPYLYLNPASQNNPVYGNSTTVQQEQVQYPYFIQIATGQETEVNITNEIELNNPFFFGMSQYFDVEPNNLSWLKSDGEYKPKAVYPDYYNWILTNVNNGVEGFKGTGYAYSTSDAVYTYWITSTVPAVGQTVYGYNPMRAIGTIESLVSNGFVFTDGNASAQRTVTRNSTHDRQITDTTNWITDYDWVINTTDGTFRLPLLNGSENLPDWSTAVERSQNIEYMAEKNGFITWVANTSQNAFTFKVNNVVMNQVQALGNEDDIAAGGTVFVNKNDIYVSNAPRNNTITYQFCKAVGNGSLYFYVGETVQNANLIDAGRMPELYATKQYATSASFPSDKYIDLTLGANGTTYTSPANGWVTVGARSNGSNAYINTMDSSAPLISSYEIRGYQTGTYMSLVFPVVKGEVFKINYNNFQSNSETIFRFVYAQGEEE